MTPAPDEQAARIAAGLSKAQQIIVSEPAALEWSRSGGRGRGASIASLRDWGKAPNKPGSGLAIFDMAYIEGGDHFPVYRLTPLGLRVRAIIAEQATDLPT